MLTRLMTREADYIVYKKWFMAIRACKDVIICGSWEVESPGHMDDTNAIDESLSTNWT